MKLKLLLLLLVCCITACSDKNVYKVAVSPSKKIAEYSRLNKIYQKYKENHSGKFKLKLYDDISFQFSNNIKLLFDKSKDFDMAIVNNSGLNPKDSNSTDLKLVKVVLPISSRILYIAYNHDKISPKNISDLFNGKKAIILTYETDFVKSILSDFGVDLAKTNFMMTKFNANDNSFLQLDKSSQDSILKIDFLRNYKTQKVLPYDIEIGFISHNGFTKSRLYNFIHSHKEFSLYSIDDYRMYNNGSFVEGFCLRNKYFTPYLLPKGTFGEYPESPILTLRQDFNLVAKDNVDDEFIYELVKTALENTDLIDLNLYGKDFNNINFAFPLHEGTKRYFDKNAPKFFEKYGSLIGKLGTGVGGFYTVIVAMMLWRKKRKRKVMNKDYQEVLDFQSKMISTTDIESLQQWYARIQDIQQTYHNLVIARKVLVDETFKLFIDTLNKNEQYLFDKITNLQKGK